MGKKGGVNKSNPDSLKEAGNKAFMNKNYPEAVKQYTLAIEITLETPNHIYFANRANAYLEMGNEEECIADCNKSLEIEPSFSKSYYRKAKALLKQGKLDESFKECEKGLDYDPDNQIIKEMSEMLKEEIK